MVSGFGVLPFETATYREDEIEESVVPEPTTIPTTSQAIGIVIGNCQYRKPYIGIFYIIKNRISSTEPTMRRSKIVTPTSQCVKVQIFDDPVLVVAGDDVTFESNQNGFVNVGPAFVKAVLNRFTYEDVRRLQIAAAQRIRHVARWQDAGTVL